MKTPRELIVLLVACFLAGCLLACVVEAWK